ncbi:MAG: zinc-ribbon domain-containing protein [archaeon]|nr:zinc-ribbon domain-containing protein [archaeon]
MYCPKCGKENPEEARFCMHCGVDLRSRRGISQNISASAEEETTKRLKKRENILYIIATVGLVIAAIGFSMEIFGILKEAGLFLGVLGILVTLISALWGAKTTIERVEGEISLMIKKEGKMVTSEVRVQSEKIIREIERMGEKN